MIGTNSVIALNAAMIQNAKNCVTQSVKNRHGVVSFGKAEQNDVQSADNKYNIVNVKTAKEVGEIAKKEIGTMPYRIATAGYSAPPQGYEDTTKSFLKMLDMELGIRSTAFITSPTADKGSIDAITSEISGLRPGKIFYTTAQDYVEYINPDNFPNTIDSAAYSKIPKYVLPNADEYSKATAEASNIFIATGGRNATVSDFVNAIKKGNKAVILNNTNINAPAWGEAKNRVENASKYLTEQINAFMKGEELPYPEVGEFTKDFMEANKDKLKSLVHVVTLEETETSDLRMAVRDTVNFIKY